MMATVSRRALKQNIAAASPNTGYTAHFVRQNPFGTSYSQKSLYEMAV